MKRLLFIINPKAGRTAIRNDLFEIIMVFSQAGYEVVTYPTQGPEDAERKVRVDGADYDLIVCAGGDGTLDNTVCGYSKMGLKKVPLGYIPVGTTNDFARSLRISRKPIEAANQIVDGKCTKIDIGQFAEKSFIYIAAFGIFTDVSYSTNQSLKKAIGHSAYIIEGIKNIGNYKGFNLTAQFDEKTITGKYLYGMVTNTLSVGGFKLRGAKHVVLDDGKFDCLFIKMPTTPAEMQQIIRGLLQNEVERNEMFFECKASRVVVDGEQEIAWTLDGEFGGSLKHVEIQNKQQALDIMLPQINIEEMAHQPGDDESDETMGENRDGEMDYTEDDVDLEDLYSRYALHYLDKTAETEPKDDKKSQDETE